MCIPDLGLDSNGIESPWSIDKLLEEGYPGAYSSALSSGSTKLHQFLESYNHN